MHTYRLIVIRNTALISLIRKNLRYMHSALGFPAVVVFYLPELIALQNWCTQLNWSRANSKESWIPSRDTVCAITKAVK